MLNCDPLRYYVVQVYEGERFLMDFEFGKQLKKAHAFQAEMEAEGLKTVLLELSTGPLFGRPDFDELEALIFGTRIAY